jgi:hypothetical protein
MNKLWEYYPLKKEDAMNIATSFAIWTSMYIVVAFLPLLFKPKGVSLKKIDDLDVRNRMISFVHGMTLLIVSGHQFYFAPGSCGDSNTPTQKMLIYTAVGYFMYDMTALFYYGLVDATMVIHHSICIIGMSLPLTYGMSANYIVMGMFIAESSNPFMHVRVILKHYGLRYTKAYECMEITFMSLYMYGRILLGSGVVWNTCLCQHNHLMVRFCSAAIMAQSVFFVG